MFRRSHRTGLCALVITLLASVLPTAAGAAPASRSCSDGARCIAGQLSDGTPYRFAVPTHWNGTVLVALDFADEPSSAAYTRRMLSHGYAVGGTSRNVTGWDIAAAVDNQSEALGRFAADVGEPRWAIASGRSMGGMVAAGAAQVHFDVFDAAVPFCGGLGGSVGQWNQKLDTVFILKTLLAPESALPVTGIPVDVDGVSEAWFARLERAQRTPAGRARIALAAAVGQLPAWGRTADDTATPMPGPHDADARQHGTYLALAGGALPYLGQAMSSRREIEQLLGGNPSWNTGVDYARQWRAAGPASVHTVRTLYRRAGLDLTADLQELENAPRVSADEAAVRTFARGIVFDGSLRVPVLTVNPIGDQISTVAQQQSYEAVAREAGTSRLLRQSYLRTVGHCTFTADERAAAVLAMTHRLETGRWSNVASPESLNRLSGGGRYLPFRPPDFNRPYRGVVNDATT